MAYGCFNRKPFVEHYTVFGASSTQPGLVSATFDFRLARDCQYTKGYLGQADAGCLRCKHREDVEDLQSPPVAALAESA